MKALTSNISRGLEIGSTLTCADNSGAKKLKVIGVRAQTNTSSRRNSCGVSDRVTVRVTKGEQEMKGETFDAVIIRQKKEYQRGNGRRISFEDNAAVLLEQDSDMAKANRVKGVVAKEVVERYAPVGKIASIVV